jgi:hypothetical protein
MEMQIENLKALIKGVELTPYQRALALTEWNNLLGYVKDLEQLNTPLVSESVEPVREGTVCGKCGVLLTFTEKMLGRCLLCQEKI